MSCQLQRSEENEHSSHSIQLPLSLHTLSMKHINCTVLFTHLQLNQQMLCHNNKTVFTTVIFEEVFSKLEKKGGAQYSIMYGDTLFT